MKRHALCLCLGLCSGLAVPVLPVHARQEPGERLFTIHGEGANRRVSCEQSNVQPGRALSALCKELGWRLLWQDDPTAALLREGAMELMFQHRDPAWVAELIAMSCGADVLFERDEAGPASHLTVTVVPAPRPESEAGRRRLREQAIRWYGSALDLDQAGGEIGKELLPQARLNLARLTQVQGDLLAAAREYERFRTTDRANPLVPQAVLEAARCYMGLKRYREARELVEELSLKVTDEPCGAAAAVLLGRILIAERKYPEAVRAMDLRCSIYERAAERNMLVLLMADAYRLLDRPDQVLALCATLRSDDQGRLPPEEQVFQLFLLGCAQHQAGRQAEAVTLLSAFLRGAPDHPYRFEGLLAFATASLAVGRDLDTIAAARAARACEGLTMAQQERLAILEAKAQVRLDLPGSREQLETEVRRIGPTVVPELTLFLGESAMESGQLEKAKLILALLGEEKGRVADRARFLILQCWARQGLPKEVVARAPVLARQIQDPQVQARVSALVGDSLLLLERVEDAAEAYRGRLR
jgi:tetratricopeptide (TPR) repeat protein